MSRQFREELSAVLRAEIACARALLEVLEHEKAAIGGRSSEALEGVAARKQEKVEALQRLTAQRGALMQRQGFAAGRDGVQHCLAATAPCPDLQRSFKELGTLARGCFEANRMNGRMINRRSRFIAGALDSLAGHGDAMQRIYGYDGKTSGSGMQRGLGHA